ncbi:MAG: hypothetical protein ACYDBW_10025 [Sulfuricaulis sp.]
MREFVGMEIKNIPIINLRKEFEDYLGRFRQEAFRQAVFNCAVEPIRLKNFTWNGLPHDLLTTMLQRSVVGLECYLCAAVHFELSKSQRLTKESEDAIENPFSLARKAVVALYEKLPALIDPSLKLSQHKQQLYSSVKTFYKTVRNPIFHGGQVTLSTENYGRVVSAFELIAAVYDWIDTWYTAFPFGWPRELNGRTHQ